MNEAGIATVGDPKVDLSDLPDRGSPLAFTIEVGVWPKAALGDWRGIEVGRREPEVSPDEVQAELERLRESLASLDRGAPGREGRLRGDRLRGQHRRRALRGR